MDNRGWHAKHQAEARSSQLRVRQNRYVPRTLLLLASTWSFHNLPIKPARNGILAKRFVDPIHSLPAGGRFAPSRPYVRFGYVVAKAPSFRVVTVNRRVPMSDGFFGDAL